MQGWRVTMEDAHTALPVLPGDPRTAFFAVFDGHGGEFENSLFLNHAFDTFVVNQLSSNFSAAIKYFIEL